MLDYQDLKWLGDKEGSIRAAEAGVRDPTVAWGDLVALQRRVVNLAKPPLRWKKPPYADAVMQAPSQVRFIQVLVLVIWNDGGEIMSDPSNAPLLHRMC